jgi:putative two-component system response regulator
MMSSSGFPSLPQDSFMQSARFLIVDDEMLNVALLKQMLERWGCLNLVSTTDGREAAALFAKERPDIVLLDLMMPGRDGFQVMQDLQAMIPAGSFLPIIVLTADITPEAKRRALDEGAQDFLTKPFNPTELFLRVRNLLQTRKLHLQIQNQNQILDTRVQERTRDLELAKLDVEKSQIEVLERLARAAEFRDDDTGQHTYRVARMAALLAQTLNLPDEWVELIRHAAPLHDVGKISIADGILLKPGKLTDEEFETMRAHTTTGAMLLSGGRSDLVQMADSIALTHHERWDGRGYPQGISGHDIPIEGRILAVADVFDALTHQRPYKKAWPVEEAVAEIARQSGKQFDPRIVDAFLSLPGPTFLSTGDKPSL